MEHSNHSVVIDRLGGNVAVAGLCRVTSQAVSKWRRDGIPPARLMFLRLARPEAFAAEEAAEPAKQVA
jgi:hypothetical protein